MPDSLTKREPAFRSAVVHAAGAVQRRKAREIRHVGDGADRYSWQRSSRFEGALRWWFASAVAKAVNGTPKAAPGARSACPCAVDRSRRPRPRKRRRGGILRVCARASIRARRCEGGPWRPQPGIAGTARAGDHIGRYLGGISWLILVIPASERGIQLACRPDTPWRIGLSTRV